MRARRIHLRFYDWYRKKSTTFSLPEPLRQYLIFHLLILVAPFSVITYLAQQMHFESYLIAGSGDKRYFSRNLSYPEEQDFPRAVPTYYESNKIETEYHWGNGNRLIMSQQQGLPEPHEHDVLMGRGGRNNQHSGNEILRQFARAQKDKYQVSSKKGKSALSRYLVHQMRQLDPPARCVTCSHTPSIAGFS